MQLSWVLRHPRNKGRRKDRMGITRHSIALALFSALAAPAAGLAADAVTDIVITEIMYDSASGDRREDFIELYNRGTVAHNLAGWRFEDGVNFTFPNVTL